MSSPASHALQTADDPTQLPPCDLVMKGGITSGVVYPRLIAALAAHYRFKSVGGTSAGAIAAAACVAAEFGRQSGRSRLGFVRLAELPDELGATVADGSGSKLLHLFQPTAALRDHFAVLVGSLNAKSAFGAVAGALRALLAKFWPLTLLAALIAVVLMVPAVRSAAPLALPASIGMALLLLVLWIAGLSLTTRGLAARAAEHEAGATVVRRRVGGGLVVALALTGVLLAFAGATWPAAVGSTLAVAFAMGLCVTLALGLAVGRFALTLLRGLQANFWGLCSGRTLNDRPQSEGLADWLTGYFDTLAGLRDAPRPLIFGDLWHGDVDDAPIEPKAADIAPAERALNLEVMTSAVSQQMSYAIPLRDNADAFWYDPLEWARLFPPRVMQWLDAVWAVDAQALAAHHGPLRNAQGASLRRLPANRHLPVVVAVRMSLSFPVLLAAVPLYARDMSLAGKSVDGQPVPDDLAKRVWFSDGGISSNMPLHMFDAPLPGHPTFAVNLKDEHPAYPIDPDLRASDQRGRVYLPQRNEDGRARFWKEPDDSRPTGLVGFLLSIVGTMQNWRDEIQFPYPGYRDRIVQVSQRADEGGLNLDMPKANITRLSDAGEFAGEQLVARFHPDGAEHGLGWQNHQRLRLRTFLGLMEALARHPRIASPHWDAVVDQLAGGLYDRAEVDLAKDLLRGLRGLGAHIDASHTSLDPGMPRPKPEMRISPRL